MDVARFDSRRSAAPMAEINMVPLIDVMMVLLVIFIVTVPLLTHAVKLQLPRASAEVPPPAADPLNLAIDAAGTLHWNGQALSRSDAAARLAEAGQRQPPPEVHLRADESVPYRVVAQTLADAARAGLTRIAFVSEPDPR